MTREGLSTFLLGAATGIGMGILFAPKSGRETRELLKENAEEGKEYLKRRGTELRDSATDIIERGKEAIGRQKSVLTDAVAAGTQASSPPPER